MVSGTDKRGGGGMHLLDSGARGLHPGIQNQDAVEMGLQVDSHRAENGDEGITDCVDSSVESDTGGPAAREAYHPREIAKAALLAGRNIVKKRKREEVVRQESLKRKERRFKEKQRAFSGSVQGIKRITDFILPRSSKETKLLDIQRSSSKTLRLLPSRQASRLEETNVKLDTAPPQNDRLACSAVGIASKTDSSSLKAVEGETYTRESGTDALRANLDFIQACKRRATGGKWCDKRELSTRFEPPCPLQNGICDPAKFMILPVNVLSPLEQFTLLCRNVRCGRRDPSGKVCDGILKTHGWSSGDELPRKIFSMYGDEFVLVRVYQCTKRGCQKDTAASRPAFFASLPSAVQQCYRFVLSKRGGVTRDFADLLMDSYVSGLPFEALVNDRNARARERYMQLIEAYISLCAVSSRGAFGTKPCVTDVDIERFGKYEDGGAYAGRTITPKRLSALYKSLHACRRDLLDRCLQSMNASGCATSFDDTFKVPKKMRAVCGAPYCCFKSVKCSDGCILAYEVSESKGAAASQSLLVKLGMRLGEGGGMHTMYSDQCCQDRAAFMKAFPSLTHYDTKCLAELTPLDSKSSLSSMVASSTELVPVLQSLRQTAMPPCDQSDKSAVGLDAEWTAGINSANRERGKVGVLQFSTKATTVVIDLATIIKKERAKGVQTRIPSSLKDFLEDEQIQFVGVGIKNNCSYLSQDYGVKVANMLDLRMLYKSLGYSNDGRKGSLAFFVQKLLKMSLPCKEAGSVRTSQWSDGLRSVEQQEYAAMDAWATALVYDAMVNLGKADGIADVADGLKTILPQAMAVETQEGEVVSSIQTPPSTGETNAPLNETLNDEPNRAVKVDPFHLIQRLVGEVRGGAAKPLARLFSVMMSMALFEDNEEDRNCIQQTATIGGITAQNAKRLPRSAYKRRVRRMIPVPSILKRRVQAVYDAFRDVKTSEGLPFFKPGIKDKLKAVLFHIEQGCVSDTLSVPLYSGEVGEVLYCGRGSSSLEAFHRHLRAAFPGFAYGAELFDALLSEYVFRNNSRAIARRTKSPGPRSVSEIVTYERFNSLCQTLNIRIPEAISRGLKPLPVNNGEVFGLQNLGDWARLIRESDAIQDREDGANFVNNGEQAAIRKGETLGTEHVNETAE